ncbi:ATP-binding protein [Thiothrix nivea]|uniref:AAA-ATPase-like protein n=1 Tax=Thiothrix nivea (strain ATCC 35100 / DSM 5205 / JP2) TaxID=870187 RepID=A0A656HFI3_THINJ|nr:ATP-binding protein [Thiothrix nivea]EIJ33939.1 AAA-ATPase-like protein [Thiothrix nivea DSM 5205]
MKIPYGESNFKTVLTGGYVYVDKTAYIRKLEEAGKYLFLLRPRRFGKSLFVSMLEHYYDVLRRDEFDALFGGLHIGQHPTASRNGYQVLVMDFSGISTDSRDNIFDAFCSKINNTLLGFLERYGYPRDYHAAISAEALPANKVEALLRICQGQKIYLLIDEYDHFANTLLADDLEYFQQIMGKGGFVRALFEVLKTGTRQGILDRLFITGVTPLMLDSLTSGFNIGENLSLHEDFNTAQGFTKEEVAGLLHPLLAECPLGEAQLMADITRWYNGYRFNAHTEETVYNADMVLYFLKNFRRKDCSYPERMLDENIASDYRKIMAMFSIGDRDANFAVLDELINQGEVVTRQRRKFEFDKGFDRDDFISLIGYKGFVSLQRKTLAGEVFGIPNHVMEELYFQYFKVELERRNQISISNRALALAVEALALHDDMQPLVTEMQQVLQALSNRDFTNMDEKHLKTLLLTLLYQNPVYFIQSERKLNQRYPDILLLERSPFVVNHQHLIELKYAKKSGGEAAWKYKREQGVQQVQGYLQLPEVAALAKLSAWLVLTDGEQVEAAKVK